MMLAKASDQAQDMERRDDFLQAGAHVPSQSALFAYLMGPDTLLAEAKAIHAEVLALEDVTEEDSSTWCGTTQGAPSRGCDVARPETTPEEEGRIEEPRHAATRDAMDELVQPFPRDVALNTKEAVEMEETPPTDRQVNVLSIPPDPKNS